MADPPSYEESASEYGSRCSQPDQKSDAKTPQRINIREEVGTSRQQHVAALISKLLPQIRDRAKQGLSKSTLLLLPSNQECSRKGQLVGFPEDEVPTLVQLEGGQDTLEFWTQQEALDQLRLQMLAALEGTASDRTISPPPALRLALEPPRRSSFWGRKEVKSPLIMPMADPIKPPLDIRVQLDEVHFRSENAYGLYETLRGRCVLIVVDAR